MVIYNFHELGFWGHLQRLANKRKNGSWGTQAWLINKDDAHIEGNKLVGDTASAKKVIARLSSTPIHVKGDVFKAKDRRDIPEREKPTPAMRKAQK